MATSDKGRGRFLIVTMADQAYLTDRETKEEADSTCAQRNKQAEDLGIVTRYVVVDTKLGRD